jgi:Cu/Ag efflux protein CusF
MSVHPSHRAVISSLLLLASFAIATLSPHVSAQTAAVVSETGPGTIGVGTVIRTKATVVGIDLDARSATLHSIGGRTFDVTVSPEVGDLGKLRVGDKVDIAYQASLLIHADKVKSNGIRERVDTNAVLPASGGVAASAHTVQVLATIEKVDMKRRLVTLRGPLRTVTIEVAPDVPLAGLKVGDSVRAELSTATAVQVTRNDASSK